MEVVGADELPKGLDKIQFGLLTSQDTIRLSEVQVVNKELYQHPERIPIKNGCLDPRMGTSNKQTSCETCGLGLKDCVGHFGYIKLQLPVFHTGFFKSTLTVLNMICKNCSRILLPEEQRTRQLRLVRNSHADVISKIMLVKRIEKLCKKYTKCVRCGNQNGLVKKVGVLKIVHEKYKGTSAKKEGLAKDFQAQFEEAMQHNKELKPFITKVQEDLSPLDVQRIFEKVAGEDCELFDMDPKMGRPELMIMNYIPVPPVCIRPSVSMDAQGTNEDDLTVKLSEIVLLCNSIKTAMEKGAAPGMLMEDWDQLQLACGLYINSELPGIPPSSASSKPARSLSQRLKGKTGRFRGNLSGKRVDFSSRTVISPDPNLNIDEVAVPELIAKLLTYPERVTPMNIERLQKMVINGADVYPGARYVEAADGVKKFLKFGDRSSVAGDLKLGDIVERHLVDGDVVLFNRQPSLHKVSIMAHKVRVMPWRTFRFNECVCTPYNADFDGDEMNLHVPQTEEARAEALTLMGVTQNLITPRNGEPLIAATQDFLSASYLITRKDTFYDRASFSLICTYAYDANVHIDLPPPTIIKPMELWTGKQIFNVLIRANNLSKVFVTLENKSKSFSAPESIPHMCPKDGFVYLRNSELLCGVMDKATLGSGNKNNLFHVIMRDYSSFEAAACMSRLSRLCARWIGNFGFSIGILDVTPSFRLTTKKEQLVTDGYRKCNKYIEKYKSGKLEAKPGLDVEQTLEGKISKTLSKIRESAGDLCMQELSKLNTPLIMSVSGAKGSNINISQMIACVGQQTVSGSRIPNGFVNRTLPHFGINSKQPAAKGFVKNSFYTGLTPTEFFFHTMGGREGLVDTAVKTAETGYMQRRLMKALEDLSAQYDDTVRNSSGGIVQFTYGEDGLDPAGMEAKDKPIDFARVCGQVQSISPFTDELPLFPKEILDHVDQCLGSEEWRTCSEAFKDDVKTFMNDKFVEELIKKRNQFGFPTTRDSTYATEKELDEKDPSSARVVRNITRISRGQLSLFLSVCLEKYRKAKVEPGTAVGAIGAQSIGEPGTQMTLKTFHFAGVASMNITLGVPRIREIIDAAKKISTPVISAELVVNDDVKVARIVKSRIEKTTLGEIAVYIKEVFRPMGCYLSVKLDLDCINALQLEVSVDSVKSSILKTRPLKLKPANVVVKSMSKLRVYPTDLSREGMHYSLQNLKNSLPNVLVKGLSGVERAIISEVGKGKFKIFVEGHALADVMATPGVNGTITTSNDIIVVQNVLGIEAARQTIMNEIQETMQSHGLNIDTRHVMLLADVMSYRGEILGITRFGMSKMKDSVLALASFEKTADILFDAAVHSRLEKIEGISERIIMGVPIPLGTGLFKVLQRSKKIQLTKRNLLLDSPTNFRLNFNQPKT